MNSPISQSAAWKGAHSLTVDPQLRDTYTRELRQTPRALQDLLFTYTFAVQIYYIGFSPFPDSISLVIEDHSIRGLLLLGRDHLKESFSLEVLYKLAITITITEAYSGL